MRLELVEVLAEVAAAPAARRCRAGRRSRQPDGWRSTCRSTQQRAGAADHVGAGTAAGQLGQVRQVGQLAGDQGGCLARLGAGHRADAGRAAGRRAPGGDRHLAYRSQPCPAVAATAAQRSSWATLSRTGQTSSSRAPAAA